jgi:hypothetical protein
MHLPATSLPKAFDAATRAKSTNLGVLFLWVILAISPSVANAPTIEAHNVRIAYISWNAGFS